MERATRPGTRNFQLGKLNFRFFIFQHLQNRSEKMCVHALHTVHALPDLRVAAGRLRDGGSVNFLKNASFAYAFGSSTAFWRAIIAIPKSTTAICCQGVALSTPHHSVVNDPGSDFRNSSSM
jgi:hypothetical protein